MILTINTDASFNRRKEVGTYAFWIVCDEFKLKMSGAIRKNCTRPEVAEYRSLLNALHMAFKMPRTNKITKIIVNTDCLNVIHLAKENNDSIKRYNLNSWGKHMTIMLHRMLKENGISNNQLDMRHIRSHQHTNSARNWVNQWCDDAAKMEMNKLLAKIESGFCKCTENPCWSVGGDCVTCNKPIKEKQLNYINEK